MVYIKTPIDISNVGRLKRTVAYILDEAKRWK